MKNQDKIYQQFKDAAGKVESKDFAGMEKVWGNIEGKLETKALKTENTTWKKIAVAASILLVATVGYQFLKDADEEIIVPKESMVSSEVKEITADSVATVEVEQKNPLIKENSEEIIQEELRPANQVAVQEAPVFRNESAPAASFMPAEDEESKMESNGYFAKRKFDAVGVRRYETEIATEKSAEEAVVVQEKASPLLVIDGKAVKAEDQLNFKEFDTDSVQYLDNPLYIINGVEYTEKELFGPNPTSPYYPLNKQEITSTTVLQGESATNLYGEKGKKGVVIISTKDKKPLKKQL